MDRIYIAGASGSGKSTLSRAISEILSIPRHDLDDSFWQPNWQPVPIEGFVSKVKDIVAGDKWIVEGAQAEAKPLVLSKADTLIWVDPGLTRIFSQICKRTFLNIVKGETICNGNEETLSRTFSRNSIFVWATRTYRETRKTLGPVFAKSADPAYKHLNLIRLRNRKDIARFKEQLAAGKI